MSQREREKRRNITEDMLVSFILWSMWKNIYLLLEEIEDHICCNEKIKHINPTHATLAGRFCKKKHAQFTNKNNAQPHTF